MTGEEIAREVISILQVTYGICASKLLACMHDSASVNGCAMRTIKIVLPNIIDVGCYSHTIDLVGEKFDTPILDEFITLWISLFAHSSLEWRTKTGISVKFFSATRWWSRFEVCHQVFLLFGDILPFLKETKTSPVTSTKLLQFFSDKRKIEYLQLELAAIVDAGEPFVKATYQLEGDGVLAFRCYEIFSTLEASVKLPNLHAMANKLVGRSHELLNKFIQYGKARIQPGLQYFKAKFSNELLSAFKAARLFVPAKLKEMKPDISIVNTLRHFTFLNSQSILDDFKSEFPQYIAKAADTSPNEDTLG